VNPPKDGKGYGADSGKRQGPQDGSGIQRGGQRQPSDRQPSAGGSRGRGRGRGRN
jgi:hypothetical protein